MHIFSQSLANSSALILIISVGVVGILHTIVPDHWAPITLIARERKWTKGQTAKAALIAGIGHVVTTLVLGAIVWIAGVAIATRFGHDVDLISSLALIAFGLWIAIASWKEVHEGHEHSHEHEHDHDHSPKGKKTRTALLLILGSSPMIEGIPAFFAAGKYGIGVIAIMAIVFALATISTYVILCVSSYSGIQRINLGTFEKYGEVISGSFIALIGLLFLLFPVL